MKLTSLLQCKLFIGSLLFWLGSLLVSAEDPYLFYTWTVTYGTRSPLGVPQQVILINGQFPGPAIEAVTNNNIVVNLINKLDEPFLITWNGVKQRRTSWQDGVLGTNCPIQPNSNWTYQFQLKDQIGTYTYFASTSMHRASGAFGALNINQRSVITTPYPTPDGDFTLLVTDWFKMSHKDLRKRLDAGYALPLSDGLLINGVSKGLIFTGEQGKTYKFRVSNVGIATSINFRIQDHTMSLIEVEGAHTLQETYESLDVHVGQSVTVLVNLKASVRDYYIVASTRFTKPILNTNASLRYLGSKNAVSGPLPVGPTYHIHWSMKQARTIRMNLTANAARPNPQGSFHYGTIPINRTLILANAATMIYGKLRYTVNRISYINPETPLKLADWYNISGVFDFKTMLERCQSNTPTIGPAHFGTSVFDVELHEFVEIIFQNDERSIQSWHMDGTSAFLVGYGSGTWNVTMRKRYNLVDAVARHTFQVYPLSWTSILVSLDNKGMWNLRSQIWSRRYLGQELYVRVWNDEKSIYTEADPPLNALYCGQAKRPR
ncbi:L-ascorbate oxidase homolog isoform X1 [Brassica rapa]|uniref:L-ascorbate oxidase homolog isoform X1 n=1 Tax=Brassica campestris TaxID=3711 RepID=UPI0004F1A5D2|nr:L-ascorbate oxidase homolog isoform X1 [Brassica rapa]